jgi:outer membrane murein-binding lipoprotein Lpp
MLAVVQVRKENAMKPASLFLVLLFLSTGLAAQTSAQGTASGTPPPPRHQHMMEMQQHMQEMKAQVAKMQANVDQMKANAAKITDPAARQQADLDAQMWQMMVDHMQGMQKMMAEHGGMMGGGMHHMHHPGAKGTPPPPPGTQPQ